jgi:superfamily II DNA or RNA helicase
LSQLSLRNWQVKALEAWEAHNCSGIISVVTGGGKTVFALACIARAKPLATLIVVPTRALLEQWWEECAYYFDLKLDEINIVDHRLRFKLGTINIAVLNTAVKLVSKLSEHAIFLVVDECHKAASPLFQSILSIRTKFTLGLSATPERPYDEGLSQILVPALGPVIFTYDYAAALNDGIIVPFNIRNVAFELEPERQEEYDKLTKSIARSIQKNGIENEKTIALFLKRTRIMNLSLNRVRLAIQLVRRNPGKRTLIFHEDIEACEIIHQFLSENKVLAGIYHSRMRTRQRVEMLSAFRQGRIDVLVTCRALDEGFNVPETELGIIAASTATLRQRIQRLGRIVRPAPGKTGATIYTLVCTGPEIERLKQEEMRLNGVANISWSRA